MTCSIKMQHWLMVNIHNVCLLDLPNHRQLIPFYIRRKVTVLSVPCAWCG